MPDSCDPNDIGIPGINHNTYDMPGFLQPYVFPASSTIFAAPYTAKPLGHITAKRALSFSHIYPRFVGGRHGHRSYRAAELLIGNVFPIRTAVCCLPYTAAGRSKI